MVFLFYNGLHPFYYFLQWVVPILSFFYNGLHPFYRFLQWVAPIAIIVRPFRAKNPRNCLSNYRLKTGELSEPSTLNLQP